MSILISTDIEGVAGVVHPDQTREGNGEYERARRWMTREANAAVAGAFDGGATEVRVNDSHGSYRNLLADELDPRARLVNGKPRTLGMMGGLEADFAGAMLVGFHARAQAKGVLAHTINSSAFARVWLNGQELGEAGLYVARVLDKKVSRGLTYLVTDGGLHHHLSASGNFGQVIRKNYPAAIANRMDRCEMETVSVVGPLCTPLDLLADRMSLPAAEPGDLVAIYQSGAYGATASPQRFLGHPGVVEVLV